MKHDELYEIEPETKLAIEEEEKTLIANEVSDYDADGDEWTNLTELREGGQEVVEVADKITRWSQVLDLLGVTTDEETVDYRGHHFVRREHNTAATVVTRTKEGTIEKDSLTSVYRAADNKNIFLSIEKIIEKTGEEKIFVWYSDRKLKPEQIKIVQ